VKAPPTGERKIKKLTRFGKISILNQHPFSKALNGFQISPRMQELMVYAGQLDSYERCNEVIGEFSNIEVSAAQVYRLTDAYGKAAEQDVDKKQCTLTPVKKEEVLYVQADGSMLLTREEGWKEVKVGREEQRLYTCRAESRQNKPFPLCGPFG
jgi:hypothetical protein